MEANELRIGNWVDYKLPNNYGNKIRTQFNFDLCKYVHLLNPIPLTPEILEKCGFEKTDDYGDQIYYERGRYYVCFDHEDIAFGKTTKNDIICYIYDSPQLQYLHQLQNLYWCLVGQELDVNL